MTRFHRARWSGPLFLLTGLYSGCSAEEASTEASGKGDDTASRDADGDLTLGPDSDLPGDSDTSGDGESDASGDGDSDEGEGSEGPGGAGGADSGTEVPAKIAPPEPNPPPASQLTAGTFDDNLSFTFFESYRSRTLAAQQGGLPGFTWQEHEAAHDAYADKQTAHDSLDIALVLDTTGSMGDELGYLQREFDSLSGNIKSTYGQVEQRWSLIVYRDEGDEYLTRSFDFTDDLDEFRDTLAAQEFGGGGDFPEAPDAGLEEANALSWRSGEDVARLVFWVADAPHHSENAGALTEAVRTAQAQDLHIYPVASSGIDAFTEFTMRASAQMTWGRYIFLTDDSGLGNSHLEPTLPCYYVTTLKDAILRSVATEMTGEHTPPTEDEVVRWGGAFNEAGNCYYGDGYEAVPF